MINIAIADDHPLVREGLKFILSETENFNVTLTAEHGLDLINKLGGQSYFPDIILLDINMPQMDGYDTMQTLIRLHPKVSVITLSTHDHELAILKMIQRGAKGYIAKADSIPKLKRGILEVYSGNFFFPDHALETMYRIRTNPLQKLEIGVLEQQFLSYCNSELSYKEIASAMNISQRTAEGYRDSLFRKLGVKTRIGLTMIAMSIGLKQVD